MMKFESGGGWSLPSRRERAQWPRRLETLTRGRGDLVSFGEKAPGSSHGKGEHCGCSWMWDFQKVGGQCRRRLVCGTKEEGVTMRSNPKKGINEERKAQNALVKTPLDPLLAGEPYGALAVLVTTQLPSLRNVVDQVKRSVAGRLHHCSLGTPTIVSCLFVTHIPWPCRLRYFMACRRLFDARGSWSQAYSNTVV